MPCYARRVRLFFAARRHAVLGCPVRAAMRGLLSSLPGSPVRDTFWCAPRTSCPVRSNAAARPRDATGCVRPASTEASISHAPRRFRHGALCLVSYTASTQTPKQAIRRS